MTKLENNNYIINDYQKQKPFSSFLSGIAGKMGKPLWAFYVNRGQAIASFGVRDKNGAIMEFYPANQSYMYTGINGFRTFIKVDGIIHEFFKESNNNQKMIINRHELSIEEVNNDLGISVKITYFTLPNMNYPGLVRSLSINNLTNNKKEVILLDGINQILPTGIDYGGLKAVGNLLQSWMISIDYDNFIYYKLTSSTGDEAEVSEHLSGNYYYAKSSNHKNFRYIYDYKLIYKDDTSFSYPYGLLNEENLFEEAQVNINQVPSGFSLVKLTLKDNYNLVSLIGNSDNEDILKDNLKDLDINFFKKKRQENELIHNDLTNDIETETNFKLFDEYLKQSYFDNLLRGGTPLAYESLNGVVAYYLYSRKHGDLERDYNFFSLEPSYYSQGNGNFRDVLQNRRNDLLFTPEIKDFNIYYFFSLIQNDGYNPLSIEGLKFKYKGKKSYNKNIDILLSSEFSIGDLVSLLVDNNIPLTELDEIISLSEPLIMSNYGEGYWQDHFTYLYDLLESYLNIYPDLEKELLFERDNYLFFNSPIKVLNRDEKYVLSGEKIRQYGATLHLDNKNKWLVDKDNNLIKANLMGKLITLTINKYALLDPNNIGIMYEANKPGWNDAMNGLPGLFGSGFGETIELKKLTLFILEKLKKYSNESVLLLKSTYNLALELINSSEYNYRLEKIEEYRSNLLKDDSSLYVSSKKLINVYEMINEVLDESIKQAKLLDNLYPTYLTYQATNYKLIKKDDKELIGNYGLPLVLVDKFKVKPISTFLEAPARYLKRLAKKEEAKEIYESVKKSELYDKTLKFYKTSVDLTDESFEIGRIKAFQKGWLERESNFLHMTYKYLLGLISSGLYDEFYEELETNLTCYMDPNLYGRNPLENSSFIVPTNNPDKRKHGEGFFARLSGSNAEMISMWNHMFLGNNLFTLINDELTFKLEPKLHKSYFKDNKVTTTLFKEIKITYYNPHSINTYEGVISKYILKSDNNTYQVSGPLIKGLLAKQIREKEIKIIDAYIEGGK